MANKRIAIIITSVRTPRVGPSVAALVKEAIEPAATVASLDLEILDLADFNLPLYDETVIPASVPAKAQFSHAHSIAWSAAIASYDAYIFVIPEYNFGVSAATKNAIDYLYNEWTGRPAAVVSYGIQGGKQASEQVKTVLTGMKLRVADTRPQLVFQGTDTFAAAGEGIIGDESRSQWTGAEVKQQLLSVFDEIKELLQVVADGDSPSS